MHKGVILLVKAEDKDDALSQVNDFMEPHGEGHVWDWFQIGGRWNNTLAPHDLLKQWEEKKDDILTKSQHGGYSMKEIEENQPLLQAAWEELGLKGKNPYCDHYKLGIDGNEYDVMPLSECIETVKEWVRDMSKEADEAFENMVKERVKQKAGDKSAMPGYYAGIFKDADYGNFCFDSNVYDITEDVGESLPEDVAGYWAVMVDMHN